MRKLFIFLLAGVILASILPTGISSAMGDKMDGSKKEVKTGEGYQLTPADKRSQFLSIFLVLVIVALTF